eukprot:9459518-Pyramimonas_sp.AAC.1
MRCLDFSSARLHARARRQLLGGLPRKDHGGLSPIGGLLRWSGLRIKRDCAGSSGIKRDQDGLSRSKPD